MSWSKAPARSRAKANAKRDFTSPLFKADATAISEAIRGHWSIENGLHWVMDMIFRDDECRIRKKNAPANFTTIKHMASNLLRLKPGKDSLRVKTKVAAWDDDFLVSLVTG